MIAADSSTFIAFLSGAAGPDVDALERALADQQACLPPAVLAELLSEPTLPARVASLIRSLPLLEATDGYWERTGLLRARLLAARRRARLADALIAQSCLDHDVALITRDADFRRFAEAAGLRILH